MILDAHHHLWNYSSEEYGWIGEGMERLARNFSADDLAAESRPAGVTGSVVVQARQTVEETDWLLSIANESDFVKAVVGWAPLVADDLPDVLDLWSNEPKLRSLRHVVQDEPQHDFLLGEEFNRGVATALDRGLTYDLLIFARQLPVAIEFVDLHPEGPIVLDHIAKPEIANGRIDHWQEQLAELAQRPNVMCKLSGLVTEADWKTWTPELLRPYMDAALDAFGTDRLMFGSDWPVCLLASEYERWVEVVKDWAAPLSADEQQAFFFRNAAKAYRLVTHEVETKS